MASQFLDINLTTGVIERQTPITTSAGAGDAGKIPAVGADGKLDPSLMPATGGDSSETITTSEALAAGDWINIHQVSNVRRVRKALGTDTTKPVHGFVNTAVNSGADAAVYTRGVNGSVPLSGFTVADAGVPVFLSAGTSGGCTKTPPSAAGNIVQRLGFVVEVAGVVRVQMDVSMIVKL
ncbi:hypothetical protein EKD04_009665 [Chloroflexales bacterium ZM16-3]|nr:hypothetical protein [Chloroflexales bacterium ZM16-3]